MGNTCFYFIYVTGANIGEVVLIHETQTTLYASSEDAQTSYKTEK